MSRRTDGRWILLPATMILASAHAASAQFLYGLESFQGGGTSSVWQIDPNTAIATNLTAMSGAVNRANYSGADFAAGRFYASNVSLNSLGPLQLAEINPVTGAGTAVNTQNGMINWQGLAGTAGGTLYATNGFSSNPGELFQLHSINPSDGSITTIGSVGTTMTGLAYDDVNGILYGISQAGFFHSINTATGAATNLGDTNIVPDFVPDVSPGIANLGLAMDAATGTFYVTYAAETNTPTSLYSFTLATIATPTLVGPVTSGGNPVPGLFSLGYSPVPVPEPATWAMLAALSAAVVPACFRMRRNRKDAGGLSV